MLLSPRNSEQASRHVLNATGCAKVVYSSERSRQVMELKAVSSSLQAWEIPGLWKVFDPSSLSPSPAKSAGDAEDRVAVYIHSSGTTGTSISPVINSNVLISDTLFSYRTA